MFLVILCLERFQTKISLPLASLIIHVHGAVFFNHKNLLIPIWSATFFKNVFIFWYSNVINNLNFPYNFNFPSTGFILIVLWYVLLYLLTISSNLSIYRFFETEVKYLNFSAITDFPSLCVECTSTLLFYNHDFTDIK